MTASGPDTAKVFEFEFGIPEGAPGENYNLTQDDRDEIAGIVETDMAGTYVPVSTLGGLMGSATIENDNGTVNTAVEANTNTVDPFHPVYKKTVVEHVADAFTVRSGKKADINNGKRGGGAVSVSDVYGVRVTGKLEFVDADGNVDDSGIVSGLADPAAGADDYAANKHYVDTVAAGKQDAGNYAASKAGDSTNAALRASSIPWGKVDATSTSTAFTATIAGITELRNGVCFWLKNGIVTSAAGFTINVNNLGGKKCYNNMTASTQDTTIFNISYTMLFVYDDSLDSGAGGFYCYRGYDTNTNTIGYQLRSNSSTLPASQKFYRYRLLFTSADGTHWVPANTSSSTNATASRTPNSTPIDPFGEIVYYGTTSAVNADANVAAAYLWQEYTLQLGYSFNNTGAALVLPYPKPIYLVCDPQTDGSAVINSTTPYATALPTTEDGKIYIFLGRTYSETNIELLMKHPVYFYKNSAIRQWTGPV